MAALLKKRAVAEFSQVIQEEPKPIKKLKLIHRQPAEKVELDLKGATTSCEALQKLLEFEEVIPNSGEVPGDAVRELIEHFHKEKEAVVRCKLANILAQLGKLPEFNTENMTEDVIILLKSEKSHKVISSLIQCLTTLGRSLPEQVDLHTQLIATAKQYIKDSDHRVRCSCLELIGCLGSPDQEVADQTEEPFVPIHTLLTSFCQDQDPRVRSSAIKAMLQFHQRGLPIGLSVYQQACQALKDDYEDVRLSAMKLVWVLSHLYPESSVPVSEMDDELRLVDDGFAKICNMVNDISVRVRMEAANLLGSLHQVSPRFLEQTLDKKLMSNMRKKRSAHERAREHFASGEWATGQKWADDAPKEEIDPENINLMNIGACGAFVHGTEDEYLEVRNSALDSLCELAAQSEGFANLSQDSIIDMFNDEIESVRLNAINSLRKLSNYITLREDQLEIIIGVLQDYSPTIREALRDMLCDMKLATKECLSKCIFGLLDNLRRYPQDRLSIWKCMKNLGYHHPHLTLPLVPELLCLHPYFDTAEPDMDDPAYISVLMLVFSSAVECPTMLTMFQDHTWQHYHYLRDSLADLVPLLKLKQCHKKVEEPKQGSSRDSQSFLQQTLQQLQCIGSMDVTTVQPMLEAMVRNLQQISWLDEKCGPSAECVCLFLQSQLLLTKLMTHNSIQCSSSISDNQVLTSVDKILSITQKLQHMFLGLGSIELSLIHQTQVKAQTIQLLTKMKSDPTRCNQMKENFLRELHSLKKLLSSNEMEPEDSSAFLFSVINDLENGKISDFMKHLQHAIKLIGPCAISLQNNVRKMTAVLLEPTGATDNPVKFTAGLTVAIPVDATLENVQSTDNIKLQVRYPDQRIQLISPPHKDFHKLSPLRHRLLSQVIISHSLWSDQSHIEVGVVVDVSEGSRTTATGSNADNKSTQILELCKPVKVLVAPKTVKR